MRLPAVLKRVEFIFQPLALILLATIFEMTTLSLWQFARGRVEAEGYLRLEARVNQVTDAISGRMIDYEQVLRGCAGLFAASRSVERGEWHDYFEALKVERNYPGIQGIGFASRVREGEKARHEMSVRAQGFPGYAIRPPGKREDYMPISYIEPFSVGNRRTQGFDLYSEPTRRATLLRARDSADIAITGKLTLLQDSESGGENGFLMYLPIYANGADISATETRRQHLAGYVFIPFRISDLMHGMLGEFGDIQVRIYDGTDIGQAPLLFDSVKAHILTEAPRFTVDRDIVVHGHTWKLQVSSLPDFVTAIDHSPPRIILISGIAISLLLLGIFALLATLRTRATALAGRMTNELRDSREQLSLALEGSELAFFDWNVTTGVVELSAEWEAMLGGTALPTTTTSAELVRLVHPDDVPLVQKTVATMLRGDVVFYRLEHRVQDRRGGWLWIMSRAKVAARDAGGRALRITGTNANIMQRKRIEHIKDEFISTVNHELRTPLTVIVGSLALLKEDLKNLAPDQAMMLDMACQNSARLQALVDDILHLEKIESGAMRFELAAVALGPFLHHALELNRMYADRFKVRYELHGPLPEISIKADRERLMQVMTNLLSNAAKFSPEGGVITVGASVAGDFVRVTVNDCGPGVPVEFKDRIFGKFEQADGSNTRRQGGSGLGLSISKAIIASMGGRIAFDSVPGQGATFYFELPAASDVG